MWGHWYPCFGLLVTSALGFKARADPLLAFLLVWSSDSTLVWHLLTVYRSAWQSSLFDPHTCKCVCRHRWRFGARNHDRPCRTQPARRCTFACIWWLMDVTGRPGNLPPGAIKVESHEKEWINRNVEYCHDYSKNLQCERDYPVYIFWDQKSTLENEVTSRQLSCHGNISGAEKI